MTASLMSYMWSSKLFFICMEGYTSGSPFMALAFNTDWVAVEAVLNE